MRFRNSFRLLLNNFKNTYMLLLFRTLVFLMTGALAAVVLASGFGFLTHSAELETLFGAFKDVPAAFFNSANYAEFDLLFRAAIEEVVHALGAFFGFLNRHIAEIVLSGIGLIFIYLVSRFLNGLALFAFGNILNDKMSQYADTPFFAGFLRNIGSAALYQVAYVPISFAFDVLSVVLCYLIFFRAFVFLPVLFALFFGSAFVIVMQAVKLSVVSDWMPSIITDGNKLSAAMKESFRMGGKQFAVRFSNYLMAIYCILAFNILFALTSFFSALLITVPASFAFLVCLQFVNYYTVKNKRYFLSYTHICDTDNPEGGILFRAKESRSAEEDEPKK